MGALSEFLFPAPAPRRVGAIVAWWERRRLAYNAWVGAAGSVSLSAFWVVSALFGPEPIIVPSLVGAVVFGVMANLCYFLGPAVEVLAEAVWGRRVLPLGPTLFRMGLTFSVGLALFPTLLLTIAAVVRVLVWVV